jgi:hypothetical protein
MVERDLDRQPHPDVDCRPRIQPRQTVDSLLHPDVTGTPRTRACIRQYRLIGLQKWRVTYLVGFLPTVMNVSLLLFFIGLVLFFQKLKGSASITIAIICLTCFAFVFYIGTSGLPIWDPQCPYKSSLTEVFNLFTKGFCIYLRASQRYANILTQHHKSFWERAQQIMCFWIHPKPSSMSVDHRICCIKIDFPLPVGSG